MTMKQTDPNLRGPQQGLTCRVSTKHNIFVVLVRRSAKLPGAAKHAPKRADEDQTASWAGRDHEGHYMLA